MRLQRLKHDWATEQQKQSYLIWNLWNSVHVQLPLEQSLEHIAHAVHFNDYMSGNIFIKFIAHVWKLQR